jgi:Mrp family chromosome partitioning ATPase
VANDGKKVLYVDADMRKSIPVRDAKNSTSVGLSNYLSHMAEFSDIVKETNIKNLYMASCGVRPPNAAELLGTNRFKDFLKEDTDGFDIVMLIHRPSGA